MEKQKIYYMVCSSPRSGSSLLCNLLENTGIAGKKISENVNAALLNDNWKRRDLDVFLKELFYVSETDNGVSGFKVHWIHMENLAVKNHQVLSNKDLAKLLPANLKYIFITRNNTVKQAVSLYKGVYTGILRKTKNERGVEKGPELDFNFSIIQKNINVIDYFNKGWMNYFKNNNISPLIIVYEDLVKDFRGNVVKILEYLGVDIPENLIVRTDLIKQSDNLSERFVLEYNNCSTFKKLFYSNMFLWLRKIYKISYKLRQRSKLFCKFFDYFQEKRLGRRMSHFRHPLKQG